MKYPVQWMTLAEPRVEHDRTHPSWEVDFADLDGVLADGQLPALSEDAHRHQLVAEELSRRPN